MFKKHMDLITLRFSPSNGEDSLGTLNPVKAHRDTWASNLFSPNKLLVSDS